MKTLTGLALILQTVLNHEDKSVELQFPSPRAAYNFRQRLYRVRDTIRKTEQHPLNKYSAGFSFKLKNESLQISYAKPNAELENILCQLN